MPVASLSHSSFHVRSFIRHGQSDGSQPDETTLATATSTTTMRAAATSADTAAAALDTQSVDTTVAASIDIQLDDTTAAAAASINVQSADLTAAAASSIENQFADSTAPAPASPQIEALHQNAQSLTSLSTSTHQQQMALVTATIAAATIANEQELQPQHAAGGVAEESDESDLIGLFSEDEIAEERNKKMVVRQDPNPADDTGDFSLLCNCELLLVLQRTGSLQAVKHCAQVSRRWRDLVEAEVGTVCLCATHTVHRSCIVRMHCENVI